METEMEAGGPTSSFLFKGKRWRPVSPGVGEYGAVPGWKRSRWVFPGVGEDGGGADRISALPDDPLHLIISVLPTKDAARTRILATRWRHLWCSAPLNLDCNDLAYNDLTQPDKLAGFVSGILSSHMAPAWRFCVPRQYLKDRDAILDAWLRSPALDNLQELDARSSRHHALSAATFRFSTTLRVFTIGGCNLSNSTVQALRFPLLKQLGIDNVNISECSVHSLIASCPVLECLFVKHAVGFSCIRINSPSIKSIGISDCGAYKPPWTEVIQLKELIIESAPCLERLLDLGCNRGLHALVVSAPKLETLGFLSKSLSDGMDPVDLSTRLVFGSTVIQGMHVDNLAMVVHTVKILAVNMKTLDLDIVIELMRCFPCLDKLYIQCCATKEKNLWRRKHWKIIRCLDIRLKTIVITSYQGFMSQVNFATFFVLNAKVLELMIFAVRSTSDDFIAKQQKKLQFDNRASRGAQFHFTTGNCLRGFWGREINHVHDLDLADPFICRY